MYPNQNYLKYFPDAAALPEEVDRSSRSPYLSIGSYVVLHKLITETEIRPMLEKHMDTKDAGFVLDLACYSILSENNAAQYYPDYAYSHPLFTPGMRAYTDSKVSDFLQALKPEQILGFLNSWNSPRSKRQRIYISYDSIRRVTSISSSLERPRWIKERQSSTIPLLLIRQTVGRCFMRNTRAASTTCPSLPA